MNMRQLFLVALVVILSSEPTLSLLDKLIKGGGSKCDCPCRDYWTVKCANEYETVCKPGYTHQECTKVAKQVPVKVKETECQKCVDYYDTVVETRNTRKCVTVYDEKCDTQYPAQCTTEQQCTMIYQTVCHSSGYNQKCSKVPKQTCLPVTKCHRMPQTNCQPVQRKKCGKVPIKVPKKVKKHTCAPYETRDSNLGQGSCGNSGLDSGYGAPQPSSSYGAPTPNSGYGPPMSNSLTPPHHGGDGGHQHHHQQQHGTITPTILTPDSAQSAPDSYGSPLGQPESAPDSYGSPQGIPVGASLSFGNPGTSFSAPDSYGSPVSPPIVLGTPIGSTNSFTAPVSAPDSYGSPVSQPIIFGAPVGNNNNFGTAIGAPDSYGSPVGATLSSTFGGSSVGTNSYGSPSSQPPNLYQAPIFSNQNSFGSFDSSNFAPNTQPFGQPSGSGFSPQNSYGGPSQGVSLATIKVVDPPDGNANPFLSNSGRNRPHQSFQVAQSQPVGTVQTASTGGNSNQFSPEFVPSMRVPDNFGLNLGSMIIQTTERTNLLNAEKPATNYLRTQDLQTKADEKDVKDNDLEENNEMESDDGDYEAYEEYDEAYSDGHDVELVDTGVGKIGKPADSMEEDPGVDSMKSEKVQAVETDENIDDKTLEKVLENILSEVEQTEEKSKDTDGPRVRKKKRKLTQGQILYGAKLRHRFNRKT